MCNFRCPRDGDGYPLFLKLSQKFSQGPGPRVINVGDGVAIQDEGVDRLGCRRDDLADPVDDVSGIAVPERGVEEVYDDTRDLFGGLADVGLDPVVGARYPSEDGIAWSSGQRVRWASASRAAATTPCSMPMSTTTARVTTARANSTAF